MNILNFYGVLIHLKNKKEILSKGNVNLYNLLKDLKKKRLLKKLDFSIYSPEDVKMIIKNFDLDFLQCPINVLDTRLVDQGLLKKLKKKKLKFMLDLYFYKELC